jgi:hypothetical protein
MVASEETIRPVEAALVRALLHKRVQHPRVRIFHRGQS